MAGVIAIIAALVFMAIIAALVDQAAVPFAIGLLVIAVGVFVLWLEDARKEGLRSPEEAAKERKNALKFDWRIPWKA